MFPETWLPHLLGLMSKLHTRIGYLLGLNSSDTSSHFLKKVLQDRSTVLDIGANRGEFSILCLDAYPSLNLVIVEPQVEMREILVKNLGERHTYIWKAASDFSGEGFLDRSRIGDRKAAISKKRTQTAIEITTVDYILKDIQAESIALMKVDAEGHDFQVLKGAFQSISLNRIQKIMFEVNYKTLLNGNLPSDIETWLRGFGYHYFYRATRWFGFVQVHSLSNYRVETQNILACKDKI